MTNFFSYESPYRTEQFLELNRWEWGLPFIVLFILILIIFKYKDQLRDPALDKMVRTIVVIIFTILYLSHYILRFAIYGFDFIVLPFQLCSISMFFAILLLLTKNKTIYTFVLFTGIAGGIISLLTPVMGYNSQYYRYYQFMGAHILLILTPIYFFVVHNYIPSKKATVYSFLILQSIAIFMMVFNYIFYTDFMFLLFDPSKLSKFPVIAYFGGIPHYLIWVELAGISYFIAGYYGIQTVVSKTKLIPQS